MLAWKASSVRRQSHLGESAVRLILLMILSGCTSLFYQPTRILYATPERFGVAHKDVFFDSSDGTRLHAWFLQHDPSVKTKGLVTFFHGNAQNLSSHFHIMAWLTKYGYDVFVFDYRGYGLSVGEPTPKKVNLDALAALDQSLGYLKEKKYEHWIVHGQSLGGAIAMRALEDFKSNEKIDLLILDCTFDSYDDVAFDILTNHWLSFIFSPLAYVLVSDSMAPTKFFKDFKQPTLVMHGKDDSIIAPEFGKRIFDNLSVEKKQWWLVDGAGHINAFHALDGINKRKVFLDYLKKML